MQILSRVPLTYTFKLFSERKDVLVFVTTRLGGSSQNHLASCNIGFNMEESAEITVANRRNICNALGIDFEKTTFQQQVHEDYISIVDLKNAGSGLLQKENALPHSDAMITTEKKYHHFCPSRRLCSNSHLRYKTKSCCCCTCRMERDCKKNSSEDRY